MSVVAPRGIHSWISSSRKAGSHRHCQHGCCWSPGEPPHEQHSSAGMHGYSAKSKDASHPNQEHDKHFLP